MDYKKVLSQWDESLEYFGWAEYLPVIERRVKLFNHDVIKLGKRVKSKWEGIVHRKQEDGGRNDCAYCSNFHNTYSWWKDSIKRQKQEAISFGLMDRMFNEVQKNNKEDNDFIHLCSGCPIEYFTKGPECVATPYFRFHDIRNKIKNDYVFHEDDRRKYFLLAKK